MQPEEVDRYLCSTLIDSDEALDAARRSNAANDLPPHDVSPLQGKFLMLLCRATQASSVLEIGTLGGYSTIWFAKGLPADGVVVTLEANRHHANVAAANVSHAGLPQHIDLRVAPALDVLPDLVEHPAAPFDVIFIDADKPNNPAYLEWGLRLAHPGTLVIGDNVVRGGHVLDEDSDDARVVGVRRFLQLLHDDLRIEATALQTVGEKGWDGFALGVVK